MFCFCHISKSYTLYALCPQVIYNCSQHLCKNESNLNFLFHFDSVTTLQLVWLIHKSFALWMILTETQMDFNAYLLNFNYRNFGFSAENIFTSAANIHESLDQKCGAGALRCCHLISLQKKTRKLSGKPVSTTLAGSWGCVLIIKIVENSGFNSIFLTRSNTNQMKSIYLGVLSDIPDLNAPSRLLA